MQYCTSKPLISYVSDNVGRSWDTIILIQTYKIFKKMYISHLKKMFDIIGIFANIANLEYFWKNSIDSLAKMEFRVCMLVVIHRNKEVVRLMVDCKAVPLKASDWK